MCPRHAVSIECDPSTVPLTITEWQSVLGNERSHAVTAQPIGGEKLQRRFTQRADSRGEPQIEQRAR